MDKSVLNDYIDACELIEETEKEIRALKRKKRTLVQDKVERSNPEWPFEPQSVTIQGTLFRDKDEDRLVAEERLLEEQKDKAEELKQRVEKWMLTIPCRMQRIIKYKIFKDLTWEETARLMGRKATGESVKKEYQRFFEKS